LGDSLKTEKDALSELRADLKTENSEMVTDAVAKIVNLQEDLAMELKVLDILVEKTVKLEVKNEKLKMFT